MSLKCEFCPCTFFTEKDLKRYKERFIDDNFYEIDKLNNKVKKIDKEFKKACEDYERGL